ncbi:MAG: aminotransferase class I/II-fold pyridoxal phosphate-dependent enzyme [Fidelibacterota bacterium]|nr:MAG: aminotransferase class I/II-fold pyridoxal phosphate-dependent enzyme [Candidatus Neomarinimicrobiota bacterium]
MKRLPIDYGFSSHAIHAGELTDDICQAHIAPIYQTSTFCFKDVEQGRRQFTGKEKGYIYSRWYNPTVEAIEEKVAALEGMELRQNTKEGESCPEVVALAFSSGMAAISTLLLTLLEPGDTVVTHGGLYGGTTELVEKLLPEMEINHVLVRMDKPEEVEKAIKQTERLGLIYLETPANPTLNMCDIAQICEIAHAHGLKVAVDNTFATPILQQPLALGADYVVHSTTKYLNGHGTTVGGIVVSRELDFVRNDLWSHKELMGGIPSPFDAWLINQGLKTLALRVERHCANAMAVARWLDQHPKVAYVAYPGLEHFHHHELARRQMRDFGGMISFELKGGLEAGVTVMNNVFLCTLAVSLGTVDTLIQHPASMTHSNVPLEEREAFGITDGLVRLSVGIEDVEDIIDDLDRALGKI